MQILAGTLALALFISLAQGAEDHWYKVAVPKDAEPTIFVGSSTLSADELVGRMTGDAPILLENLRDLFAQPSKNLAMGWHPDTAISKMYISPGFVVYISELKGDPTASDQKADQ